MELFDKRTDKRTYVPLKGVSTMKDFFKESVIHMDFESEIDAQVEDAMEALKGKDDLAEMHRLQGAIYAFEASRTIFSVILGLIEEEGRNESRRNATE